jgi:hypothetical protein
LAKPGSALLGAQVPAGWSRPTEPFRIVGNVYWVGTHDLSSYLITSPEGHIVINTALADSVRAESGERREDRVLRRRDRQPGSAGRGQARAAGAAGR